MQTEDEREDRINVPSVKPSPPPPLPMWTAEDVPGAGDTETERVPAR